MTLTVTQANEAAISQRIKELVNSGDILALLEAEPALVLECARRYIEARHRAQSRAVSRSREQVSKVSLEAELRMRQKVRIIAEDMAVELRATWSREMLAETFLLPDGTLVTWGQATREQHAARALYLENLAAGSLQTASIHRRAERDIADAHVSKLEEIA